MKEQPTVLQQAGAVVLVTQLVATLLGFPSKVGLLVFVLVTFLVVRWLLARRRKAEPVPVTDSLPEAEFPLLAPSEVVEEPVVPYSPDVVWVGAKSRILAVLIDGAAAWIGTEADGLYHLDLDRSVVLEHVDAKGMLPAAGVTCLALGDSGELYAGSDKGLLRRDASGWTRITFRWTPPRDSVPPDTRVRSLCVRDGRLWVGTWHGTLVRDWRGQWRGVAPGGKEGVYAIVDDEHGRCFGRLDGALWETGGVWHFGGGQLTLAMVRGRDGALWIGTEHCLVRFPPGVIPPSSSDWWDHRVARFPVDALLLDGDTVWADSPEGVFRQGEDGWDKLEGDAGMEQMLAALRRVPASKASGKWPRLGQWLLDRAGVTPTLPGGWGSSRFEGGPDGMLLLLADEGVARWQAGSWVKDGRFPAATGAVTWRADGTMIAAAAPRGSDHLRVVEIRGTEVRDLKTTGLPQKKPTALLVDSRGDLWIGLDGGGVARHVGTKWEQYRKKDGLPSLTIECLTEDPWGRIWAGTDEALAVFEDGQWQACGVMEEEPTIRLHVHWIEGRGDRLWVLYGYTLYCFRPDAVERIEEMSLQGVTRQGRREWLLSSYGTPAGLYLREEGGVCLAVGEDSLPNKHSDFRDVALAPDGAVWIANVRGGLVGWKGTPPAPEASYGDGPERWWDRYLLPIQEKPKRRQVAASKFPEVAVLQKLGMLKGVTDEEVERMRADHAVGEEPPQPWKDVLTELLIEHDGFCTRYSAGVTDFVDLVTGFLRERGALDLELVEEPPTLQLGPLMTSDAIPLRLLDGKRELHWTIPSYDWTQPYVVGKINSLLAKAEIIAHFDGTDNYYILVPEKAREKVHSSLAYDFESVPVPDD